jgi:hypothetical protein
MNFNFENLEVRKKKNTRTSTGFTRKQEFNGFKFQVKEDGTSKFTASNAIFEKLGLENKSLFFGSIEGTVFIGVVNEDHSKATLFKTSKGENGKSKVFTSTVLQEDLEAAGILSSVDQETIVAGKPNKQFFTLEEVSGDGMPEGTIAMYRVVADEAGASNEESEDESSNETEDVTEEDVTEEAVTEETMDDDF